MPNVSGSSPVVRPLPYAMPAVHWFQKIRALPLPVLLSSGTSTHRAARYDIVTADPAYVLRTSAAQTVVTAQDGAEIQHQGDPFEVLSHYATFAQNDTGLPFTGGVIGYWAYELLHTDNRIDWSDKASAISLPTMLAGVYRWAIVIDHQKQASYLVMRDMNEAEQSALTERLSDNAAQDIGSFALTAPFVSNFSKAQYLKQFQRIIDYIHAGDCYQVNLAQCFTASCTGDNLAAFIELQQHANAPFSALIEDNELAVLSFSPERFLRVSEREVLTQPIKGTRPRSSDPEQDLANRLDLENSQKDRAENLMIVDLLRNDLGRVCDFGSVSVEKLFETQSFTNVHHLVSTIKGHLSNPEDVFKLLSASFPGGSITGTPKLRAMEIINELEDMPRSVYCGAIGWIDVSGNMDSNICIRTLVRDKNQIHCWGGGGIVADSNGDEEYQETLDKISMLINNL